MFNAFSSFYRRLKAKFVITFTSWQERVKAKSRALPTLPVPYVWIRARPFIQRNSEKISKLLEPTTSRLALLLFGLLALLSLAFAKFFMLQVSQGERWQKLAEKQHLLQIPEPFFRGSFWLSDPSAHHNWPLAYDIARFHLYADCTQLPEEDKKSLVWFLSESFELSPFQITHLEQQLSKRSRSRRLISNLDLDEKRLIEQWWQATYKSHKLQKNALFFIQDHVRSHPGCSMLGALVHTTQTLKDEKTGQALATGGLELYFDRKLQGTMGSRSLQRTLKNPLASSEKFTPAQHGSDIVLTINPRLQAVAEKVLQEALVRYQAKGAWVIAMDPYSGKILCFAQAPAFDIENYAQYFANDDLSHLAKLWGVTNAYEPGSVMKPFTLAIGLKANDTLIERGERPLFDPKTLVPVRDGRLPGRKKALGDTIPVDYVNMDLGIQLSSNIYMAKLMHELVDRLGPTWYQQQLHALGFGRLTGVELPSQTEGLVPTPGKVNAWGNLEWSLPTTGTLAIGHNILTNSLQLLSAYCALANGGWLVNPTLVEAIYSPTGSTMNLQYKAPRDARASSPKVLSHQICKRVREAMCYTLKSRGSCVRANIPHYSVAAKTGTANKFFSGLYDPNHTLSTCICIVPAENPKVVLLLSVDESRYFFIPGEGYNHRASFCCTTPCHRILQQLVGILGIEPDQPHSYLPRDPRFDPQECFWYKENEALQEIFKKWNNRQPPSKPPSHR